MEKHEEPALVPSPRVLELQSYLVRRWDFWGPGAIVGSSHTGPEEVRKRSPLLVLNRFLRSSLFRPDTRER